jgi:hypothetical protein
LYGCADAGCKFFDADGEDLSYVDPDYAVPGEGEECLFWLVPSTSFLSAKMVREGTYSIDVNANDSHPTSDALLLGFGEVDMFSGYECANIPKCETRAYGTGKEELAAAEAINKEGERKDSCDCLDRCVHACSFDQYTHLAQI